MNEYGVDTNYFVKEFQKLIRDIDMLTPEGLSRYLKVLSDVAAHTKATK